MADTEDESEFESHFLDSMLEVEMTEDDNEIDVSKNCDPFESLPPIPTFDLQSETLYYKDPYKNAIPQPVLATLPLPDASKVPLVLNTNSLLIYSGETPTQKPAVRPPLQKISPKPSAKILAKPIVVNNTQPQEAANGKFIQEVFKPEFVHNVFVEKDTQTDIAVVSEEEMKYYTTCFKDVSKVKNCRLHCTICNKHLGCSVTVEKKINVHNMLKVLTCKPCHEFYGDGNFPCDKGDNCEIYCRWCGQGGALVCCSFCPRVFCKRCVKRNYGPSFLKSIEKASDWACFCCAQKPLWPHRAVCRALLDYLALKKTDPKTSQRDNSSCCKPTGLVRKRLRAALNKNNPPTTNAPTTTNIPATTNTLTTTTAPTTPNALTTPTAPNAHKPPNAPTAPKPPNAPTAPKPPNLPNTASNSLPKPTPFRNKSLLPPKPSKPPKQQILFTTSPRHNPPEPRKHSLPSIRPSKSAPPNRPSIFSSRSILTGNTIIRGITTTNAPKFVSPFPSPQLLQSPVLHGETLITPPPRLLLQAKTRPPAPPQNSSYVRVSLTHQAPNLDVGKIPTVKIPHEVQGLVLRLIFPDNRMQYIRLASDGSGCRASKVFPMPQFPERGSCFVEENLAEAFKVCKAMYEKLLRVREKVSSRTKLTEESVLNSSVSKLQSAYGKTADLFKELERTLREKQAEWKKGGAAVDVIDISDDEAGAGKKAKGESGDRYSSLREKCRMLNDDDSDIEILEDVAVNGNGAGNSNFKEKYRLRSGSEPGKTRSSDERVLKKRRKGKARKQNKKPRMSRVQNGKPEEANESGGAGKGGEVRAGEGVDVSEGAGEQQT